jgi:hypothetical protein
VIWPAADLLIGFFLGICWSHWSASFFMIVGIIFEMAGMFLTRIKQTRITDSELHSTNKLGCRIFVGSFGELSKCNKISLELNKSGYR